MTEAGQVGGQCRVVLAVGLEEHVEAGEAGGQGPGVGPGVVDGVGEKDGGAPAGRRPAEFGQRHRQGEVDVGQPPGRDAQQVVEEAGGGPVGVERLEEGGVAPEGHDGEVLTLEVGGHRPDGGGHGADLLALHRSRDVDHQGHRPAGADPFPHDDVGVAGRGPFGQHLDRAVEVDVVGAVAVGKALQPAGAPLAGVVPGPGRAADR